MAEGPPAQLTASAIAEIKKLRIRDKPSEYVQYDLKWYPPSGYHQRPTRPGKPSIRFPTKLSAALFPLHPSILASFSREDGAISITVHDHLAAGYYRMVDVMKMMGIWHLAPTAKHNMNDLISLSQRSLGTNASLLSRVAHGVALKGLQLDLQYAMKAATLPDRYSGARVDIPDFVYAISRLRTRVMAVESNRQVATEELLNAFCAQRQNDVSSIVLEHGDHLTHYQNETENWTLYVNQKYFFFLDHVSEELWLHDADHLDFALNTAEVIHRLTVLTTAPEFSYASSILQLVRDVILSDLEYPYKVDCMKAFESICLMKADTIGSPVKSWSPILDALESLRQLDKMYSGDAPGESAYIAAFSTGWYLNPGRKLGLKLLAAIQKLSGLELLEVSSIHKCCLYAEVDEVAGLKKFLSRTHTERKFSRPFINRMVGLAKLMFTRNFTKKFGTVPIILGPFAKKAIIHRCAVQHRMRDLDAQSLEWWSDVRFGKSIEIKKNTNPLEFGKDKGALREEVTYGPGESNPELLEIITRAKYVVKPLPYKTFANNITPRITCFYPTGRRYKQRYAARAITKEREQKREGRLHCNTNVDNKHGLSYYMDAAKLMLSYVDGEQMTISDSKRKTQLHEAGQLLMSEDHYSILADIEGHNQSMQHGNVGPLLDFWGDVLGLADFGKLALYFKNLMVHHYGSDDKRVVLSRGQHGGIEGWMNPVWTAHTALLCHMMKYELKLTMPMVMVYSDDVNIILNERFENSGQIAILYQEMVDHFAKAGMTLKPSQTMISSNRVTMLRKHYFKGQLASSTLKRLLSTSMFNEDTFLHEQLEVAGISSAVSSSLELTNQPVVCLYLKWYLAAFVVLRSSAAYFEGDRRDTVFKMNDVTPQTRFLFSSDTGELIRLVKDQSRTLSDRLLAQTKRDGVLVTMSPDGDVISFSEPDYLGPMTQVLHAKTFFELFCYLTLRETFLQEFIIYRLLMPVSCGGIGLDVGLSQMLSGHSDSYLKKITAVQQMIACGFESKPAFFNALSHAVSAKVTRKRREEIEGGVQQYEGPNEVYVMSSNFPKLNSSPDATSIIDKHVRKFVDKKCVNIRLRELLDLAKSKTLIDMELLNLCRGHFHFRVAEFYSSHSACAMSAKFIKKVESSHSFVKKSDDLDRVRASLYNSVLYSTTILFSSAIGVVVPIRSTTDVVAHLERIRQDAFPNIVFQSISEPLYEHNFELTKASDALLYFYPHSGKRVVNNVVVYKPPVFSSEARFKGDKTEDHFLFDTTELEYVYLLLIMTKWVIHASIRTMHFAVPGLDLANNVVQMANTCLQTLCEYTYDRLQGYVKLPRGGEVYHRLPNMTFETSSSIRVLPNEVPTMLGELAQNVLVERNWLDSNINFELLKFRFQLATVLRNYLRHEEQLVYHFRLKSVGSIKDVRVNFLTVPVMRPPVTLEGRLRSELNRGDFLRISYLSWQVVNDEGALSLNTELIADLLVDSKLSSVYSPEEIVLSHYHKLQKEHIYVNLGAADGLVWLPFLSEARVKIPEWSEKTNKDLMNEIRGILEDRLITRRILERRSCMTMDHNIIVDYLKLELGLDDLGDLFWSMLTAVAKCRSIKTKIDKLKQTSQYNAYREEAKLKPGLVLYKLLMVLIVKYTMSYSILRGKVLFSVSETDEFTTDFLNLGEDHFMHDQEIMAMMLLYDAEMIIERYKTLKHTILGRIRVALCNFVPTELYVDTNATIPPAYSAVSLSEVLPEEAKSVTYSCNEVNAGAFEEFNIWANACKVTRTLSELYANPESNFSATRSDSQVSQYGLFKALLSHGVWGPATTVCDVTAGRGDGLLAAKELGIKMTSYAIKDQFTQPIHVEGVNIISDYDVFKPDTIAFARPYDHAHFDLSFSGGVESDLSESVLTTLQYCKSVTVRLNSLSTLSGLVSACRAGAKMKVSVMFPVSQAIKPYQIYLLIQNVAPTNPFFDERAKLNNVLTRLVRSYVAISRYSAFRHEALFNPNDSISALVKPTLTLAELLHTDLLAATHFEELSALEFLVSKGKESETFTWNSNFLPNQTIWDDCGGYSVGKGRRYVEIAQDKRMLGLGLSFDQQRHYSLLASDSGLNLLYSFATAPLGFIAHVGASHPLLSVRQVAYIHHTLRFHGSSLSSSGLDGWANRIEELKSNELPLQSKLSVGIREALAMMAYAKLNNSYELGLIILWARIRRNERGFYHRISVLKYYRKLSHFYTKWTGNGVNMHFAATWCNEFRADKGVFNPMIARWDAEVTKVEQIGTEEEARAIIELWTNSLVSNLGSMSKSNRFMPIMPDEFKASIGEHVDAFETNQISSEAFGGAISSLMDLGALASAMTRATEGALEDHADAIKWADINLGLNDDLEDEYIPYVPSAEEEVLLLAHHEEYMLAHAQAVQDGMPPLEGEGDDTD